jgi:hypothetical protein
VSARGSRQTSRSHENYLAALIGAAVATGVAVTDDATKAMPTSERVESKLAKNIHRRIKPEGEKGENMLINRQRATTRIRTWGGRFSSAARLAEETILILIIFICQW